MDDVVHLDDKVNLDDEFIAEPLSGTISGDYDIHFNNAKRHYINVLPGDVSTLGIIYTDYGHFVKFPDVQWIKFRDALTSTTTTHMATPYHFWGSCPT